MSMTTASPALMAWSRGWAWGMAPQGPAATIVGKERPSAPCSRAYFSISQATRFSVHPGLMRGGAGSEGGGPGGGGRAPRPLDLRRLLDAAQRLDEVLCRDELGPLALRQGGGGGAQAAIDGI